jgi:hypothetical protein
MWTHIILAEKLINHELHEMIQNSGCRIEDSKIKLPVFVFNYGAVSRMQGAGCM